MRRYAPVAYRGGLPGYRLKEIAMKVLIAGASGAIGRPLIQCLRENGHAVIALVRSPESSRAVAAAGAEPVIADALDAAAVQETVVRVRPDGGHQRA